MAEKFDITGNMSDPHHKARMIAQVGALQDVWRVTLTRYRPRRSDRQNRYYHPCFVQPFACYLIDEGHDMTDSHEAAHEILKARFLKVQIIDEKTGQRFVFVRSTTSLTTVEFNDYLDRCAAFLAELGITVPEPNVYHEPITPSDAEQASARA